MSRSRARHTRSSAQGIGPEYCAECSEDRQDWVGWPCRGVSDVASKPDPLVTIAKNERGAWSVYIDGCFVSDHASRDAAATSANNHIRIARLCALDSEGLS